MRIVAITDIHGKIGYAGNIHRILSAADLLVIAGDVTPFGAGRARALRIASGLIGSLRVPTKRILSVPGNCDPPIVVRYLSENTTSIDRNSHRSGETVFTGAGGSLPGPARTPNEYDESGLANHLEKAAAGIETGTPFVLVSHQPPFDTAVDIAFNRHHVGSRSVRVFIEQRQPMLCITGHIHEARGRDYIGRTLLVNPGPLRSGYFAVIDIHGGEVNVDLRRVSGA